MDTEEQNGQSVDSEALLHASTSIRFEHTPSAIEGVTLDAAAQALQALEEKAQCARENPRALVGHGGKQGCAPGGARGWLQAPFPRRAQTCAQGPRQRAGTPTNGETSPSVCSRADLLRAGVAERAGRRGVGLGRQHSQIRSIGGSIRHGDRQTAWPLSRIAGARASYNSPKP